MNLLKINLISFKSNKNIDFFSKNDIKVTIKYGDYYVISDTIKNNNYSFFNKEYLFKYIEDANIILKVYETDNILGDIEIYKEIIFKIKNRQICNNQLKFTYEIIYNEFDKYLIKKCFDTLYNNIIVTKLAKIKAIV
jgi:hypothetical protein